MKLEQRGCHKEEEEEEEYKIWNKTAISSRVVVLLPVGKFLPPAITSAGGKNLPPGTVSVYFRAKSPKLSDGVEKNIWSCASLSSSRARKREEVIQKKKEMKFGVCITLFMILSAADRQNETGWA